MSDQILLLLGFLLVCLPVGLKIIQLVFSKPDKRFKLGYKPGIMSVNGWFITAVLGIVSMVALFIMVKS